MSHGGAPPWVYKREIASLEAELASSRQRGASGSQEEIDRLSRRIKDLEAENAELKRQLEESRKPK